MDSLRILVIDDNSALRQSLTMALQMSGHAVTAAANGEEGAWALEQGAFDVVVTDMILPSGDGVQTLQSLRAIHADIPVIGISGTSDYLDSFTAMGGSAVLAKPFTADQLIELIIETVQPG